jgi:hypothetical protein
VAAVLATGALACVPAAAEGTTVTVEILPSDTSVSQLAAIPGMSVGVMSTGIGKAPAEQTYLDISQGNRVNDVLYDRPLPPLRDFLFRAPHWEHIVQRAESAPADIVPGLLASALRSRGIGSAAVPSSGSAALMAVDRSGILAPELGSSLTVFGSGVGIVRKEATDMPSDELLLAIAAPSSGRQTVPIGIVGSGFHGNLASDSTRTDGYVLSTDLAPTILRRFGLPIPDEMDGEPIRSEGAVDPGAVEDLADRMAVVPNRRGPVVILSLVAWIVVAALAAILVPGARRAVAAWLALAFAYMPLILVMGSALEPSELVEGLLVGFGAAAFARLTLWLVRGWWALAIACAITVTAYAIDVIAGSPLTKLSLLGPNPIFGVRFYGIGNELEALIAVMVPVGIGAGLSAYGGGGREVSRRAAVAAFLSVAVIASIVFGAGRFGADVGAAIVLPVGAVAAALALPSSGPLRAERRRSLAIAALIGVPILAVVALVFIDLVSGGNAHLTRSVIDAGGAGNLADVAQRRLELSAHDFAQAGGNPLFWIVVVGLAVAVTQWRRIDAWLRPAPAVRAGLAGACAAVLAGVLVNDSGATFLTLGALALGAALAFAWGQVPPRTRRTRTDAATIRRSPRNPGARYG